MVQRCVVRIDTGVVLVERKIATVLLFHTRSCYINGKVEHMVAEKVFTVTEITRLVSNQLKSLGRCWIEAEVSSFKLHVSRHWYFDIKDEHQDVSLKCCMFSNVNRQMTWRPKVGDKVRLSGQLNLHRGTVSLIVYRMEKSGLGAKELKLQELRQKLLAEGLFDQQRKRPLPRLPKHIGIATSKTSAALRDIIAVLKSRLPGVKMYIAHCTTEGASAATDIVRALRLLNEHGKSEVILVGRGGGSKDSLSAFDEEVLIRAIANSTIPTVCAVGHETDNSLSDLVADHRAATPTHAAELVSPVTRQQLLQQVTARRDNLLRRVLRDVQSRKAILQQVQPRDPFSRINESKLRLATLKQSLHHAMQRALEKQGRLLVQRSSQLSALDPTDVLRRGYSVTLKEGKSVVDAGALSKGDVVVLRFETGKAYAKITKTICPGDFEQLPLRMDKKPT